MPGRERRSHAPVFAALGDENRLRIVNRLAAGQSLSVTELCSGVKVTRQAISKHLRVLETAGLVAGERIGRESRYQLSREPLDSARAALEAIANHWDQRLTRLKALVERD